MRRPHLIAIKRAIRSGRLPDLVALPMIAAELDEDWTATSIGICHAWFDVISIRSAFPLWPCPDLLTRSETGA
jgi:hypothetical protein